MHWNDLSLKDKSDLMRLYIKNGIYSLEEMKKDFNESSKKYDMGGPLNDENKWYGDVIGGPLAQDASKQNGAFVDIDFLKANGYEKGIGRDNKYYYTKDKPGRIDVGNYYSGGESDFMKGINAMSVPLNISMGIPAVGIAGSMAPTGLLAEPYSKAVSVAKVPFHWLNKFNKTTFGKALDFGLTVDGVRNLATDNGIQKTIRKAKEGDIWGTIKSGAGDALDLLGGVGTTGRLFGKAFGFNGINKRFAEASLRGGDNFGEMAEKILTRFNINTLRTEVPKVYDGKTTKYILTGIGKPTLNYQGNFAGQKVNIFNSRDYIDMGLNPKKYANDFITLDEADKQGLLLDSIKQWAEKNNVNKVFNAGDFNKDKLMLKVLTNAEKAGGILKDNPRIDKILGKDLNAYSSNIDFTNPFNDLDAGNFHIKITPKTKNAHGISTFDDTDILLNDAYKYYGKDLIEHNLFKYFNIDGTVKKGLSPLLSKGFDLFIGNYHKPFVVVGKSIK